MKNIAIITGASSGIGEEYFRTISAKESFDEIWVVARNKEKLESLQALTETKLRIFALDLSEKESTDVITRALEEEKPSIKYLVCASGFGRFLAVEEDDPATLQNMVDLNCRSIVGITTACYGYMAKGGAMILIASVAAFQPIPYIATYGATKAFVLSYGRALDKELRKSRGARCLCVCPFWTKTAFFSRAETEKQVVKKYAVMYEPKQIVAQTFKDLKHKKRDVSIYGATAKGQVLLVKLAPHRFVMWVWQKQQSL